MITLYTRSQSAYGVFELHRNNNIIIITKRGENTAVDRTECTLKLIKDNSLCTEEP